MDSFVFALDTTMPVFLVILLGWFLRRVGILNEGFCKPADQYVFKCALPVSLFLSIAKMDVYSDFDPLFCLFCFTVTAIVFLGVWALTSRLMKDKALVGEFSQAAVRSSAAILGVALNTNIYGDAGMVPMMVLSAVPFFNVYAVLILQFSPHTDENGRLIPPERNGAAAVRCALVNVVKNPIILGILLGVPFSLLRVKLPGILASTLSTIGGTATPVALLAVGGALFFCLRPGEAALEAQIDPAHRAALRGVLAHDPRPSYQSDPERLYGVAFAEKNVRFTVRDGVLTVRKIEEI